MTCPPKTVTFQPADPIKGKFPLLTEKGNSLELALEGDHRVLRNEKKELARIICCTGYSGTLVVDRVTIGEYEIRNQLYHFLPYEKGLKQFEKEEQIHPLDYLIRHLSL